MGTGACSVDCDVCRLRLLNVCSSCGSGKSEEAEKKIAAQISILGAPCPILACAQGKKIAYCMRDCSDFPCDHFFGGPYPFSKGFLNMQKRRREEQATFRGPTGESVTVHADFWEELEKKDLKRVSEYALAKSYPPLGLIIPVFGEVILIDRAERRLKRLNEGDWVGFDHTLLELISLLYLLNVGPEPIADKLISVQELKDSHFFQGPHELRIAPLLERYGDDLEEFRKAGAALGGEKEELADAAFKILPFPKVPLYYLLWEGDEEFAPRISILFDRTIERIFSADGIWGVVNLVTDALLRVPETAF
ncbi:DUF3786 domain-containing protein [Thermodesulfobacteriota bacterium]